MATTTPDYHLPWTGEVVEELLRKMYDFDPNTAGGITVLTSTESSPAESDTVLDAGNYVANYMTSTLSTWPSDLTGVTPINLIVYEKDGVLYQLIEGMGDRYVRYSSDTGTTWSEWESKPIASGGIGTGSEDEKNALEQLQDDVSSITERLDALDTSIAGFVTVGTTEEATAMLNETYDWDNNTITT